MQVGRCVGLELKPNDFDGTEFWYRRTYELDNLASTISCACRAGSHLHKTVTGAEGHHYLIKTRIAETLAAAALDGLVIPQEHAEALLKMDRAPQNATERLLANKFLANEQLTNLTGEPFSAELFRHLRDILIADVDMSQIELGPVAHGLLVGTTDYADERCQEHAESQMSVMADVLNLKDTDPDDLAALKGNLIADAFARYRPLGLVSSQVGRLCARLFAIKQGLPVLALLPVSRAELDWEQGTIAPPDVAFDKSNFEILRRRNAGDLTPYQTVATQLTLLTLRNLEDRIATWERRDAEMREVLRHEPLLNQRQRAILARALRAPEAEFQIRYHKTNHNIAYTTARRDLLELYKKNYLTMEQRGKAFVFLSGPRLDELQAARRTRKRQEH